jgi:hypothetical protein
MSVAMRTLRLVWPREVTDKHVAAAIQLLATTGGTPLVLEALGQFGRVEHRLTLSEGRSAAVTTQLRHAIPGLGIEGISQEEVLPVFNRAIELRLSTARRPLQSDQAELVSGALLTALAHVGRGEALVLRWVLQSSLAPTAVPSRIEQLHDESFMKALLKAPFQAPGPADADTRTALRNKREAGGWRAIGQVAVQAATPSRQEQLLRGVLHALRTAEAAGVHVTARSSRPSKVASVGGRARLRISRREMTALCAWPIGSTTQLPVTSMGSRRLPAPSALPTSGRVVGESTWPGQPRPLALSPEDSRRHLHVLGPTGVGKSTLLLGLIEQDMAAGRSVVVIEPKGDLIHDVLARVPQSRLGDVILLDPTDTESPVGLNPLATGGRSAELVADQLLATFHGLYAAHWGPRTSDILHAALLTLARTPGMSLPALPLLLGDPAFRRRIIGKLNDPLGLGPFWASFEAWSEAERTTAIAPVMNKLRPFLMRPSLRRIVGQAEPKLQLSRVFTSRSILLVNLAKGAMGAEAASLLGALMLAGLWQRAQERSSIQPEKRHPVFVYIDEFQDYLHLPTDLGEALAQARGLGIGLVLAHQHLAQLTPSMRAGVLANARSRICFQLPQDDAKVMAASSTLLSADDFSSLGTYQFYGQLMAAGAVQPWCSARSLPPAKPSSDAQAIRTASQLRYGLSASAIDAALEQLVTARTSRNASDADDLAPKRRRSGGPS